MFLQEKFLTSVKTGGDPTLIFKEDGRVERTNSKEEDGLDNAITSMLMNKF